MTKLTNVEVLEVAKQYKLTYAVLKMFWEVESSGYGFDSKTGKILIQFEPVWFKRLFADWKKSPAGSLWIVNKVEVQSKEWAAFNSAYGIDAEAAMEATSIGAGQIMGLHWKRLGYKSVHDMWESFKKSERNQLEGIARFIVSDKKLLAAVKSLNFHLIACYYNGFGYEDFAIANHTVPYNIKLSNSHKKHSA